MVLLAVPPNQSSSKGLVNIHRRVVCSFLIASGMAIACDTYFQSGVPTGLAPGGTSSSAAGDFDRDGKQDLVFGFQASVRVFSVTSYSPSYTTTGLVTGVTVADFNRDGLLDIAYADKSGVIGIL